MPPSCTNTDWAPASVPLQGRRVILADLTVMGAEEGMWWPAPVTLGPFVKGHLEQQVQAQVAGADRWMPLSLDASPTCATVWPDPASNFSRSMSQWRLIAS